MLNLSLSGFNPVENYFSLTQGDNGSLSIDVLQTTDHPERKKLHNKSIKILTALHDHTKTNQPIHSKYAVGQVAQAILSGYEKKMGTIRLFLDKLIGFFIVTKRQRLHNLVRQIYQQTKKPGETTTNSSTVNPPTSNPTTVAEKIQSFIHKFKDHFSHLVNKYHSSTTSNAPSAPGAVTSAPVAVTSAPVAITPSVPVCDTQPAPLLDKKEPNATEAQKPQTVLNANSEPLEVNKLPTAQVTTKPSMPTQPSVNKFKKALATETTHATRINTASIATILEPAVATTEKTNMKDRISQMDIQFNALKQKEAAKQEVQQKESPKPELVTPPKLLTREKPKRHKTQVSRVVSPPNPNPSKNFTQELIRENVAMPTLVRAPEPVVVKVPGSVRASTPVVARVPEQVVVRANVIPQIETQAQPKETVRPDASKMSPSELIRWNRAHPGETPLTAPITHHHAPIANAPKAHPVSNPVSAPTMQKAVSAPGKQLTGMPAMVSWSNQKFSAYNFQVTSLKDNRWKNGQAFCALADTINKGFYANHFNSEGQNLTPPEVALQEAFKMLETKKIPAFLDAEDHLDWDDKSIYTYMGQIYRVLNQ